MKQNWLQLAVIQIGGAICLPVILIGSMLMKQYGWQSALVGIVIGNIFLFTLSVVYVVMTVRNRKTTMENAKEYFGDSGGKLFSMMMALSLTGWFAVQLNLITIGLGQLGLSFIGLNLLVGAVITITALRGIKSLQTLSDISVPFLIATLCCTLWKSDIKTIELPFTFSAISMVIAASIAAVVDLPTYFRHAKSERDGIIAVSVLFLLAIPLVEVSGIFLATELFENTWMAPFLILAGWTTNATNLYSNVACIGTAFPSLSQKSRVFGAGLTGTALASFDVLDHFELALELMGTTVTAMGAVIAVRFLFRGPLVCPENYVAWAVGTVAGYLSFLGYLPLTTIPQLDAFLVASILIGGTREKAYI